MNDMMMMLSFRNSMKSRDNMGCGRKGDGERSS
jgi:hypothetical protein